MMQLHTLRSAHGATQARRRIGRGQGSGRGGTATRGHKGAQSRSGYKRKRAFEGGQLPLQKRIPRYGFINPNKVAYKVINLQLIEQLAVNEALTVIDAAALVAHGLVSKKSSYKVLGLGTLRKKLDVYAHAFSRTARAAIEQLGGRAILIERHG